MQFVSRQTRQWVRVMAGAIAAAGVLGALFARPAAAGVLLINDTYKVVRFNAQTGVLIDTLVPQGAGGLQFVTSMAWGPDGNLYVGDSGSSSILRFNGSTGAPIDTFVPVASGGLDYPSSIAFGPDGNLYVSNVIRPGFNTGPVLRFNGTTGALMGQFIPSGTGGLVYPWNLLLRGDGSLFVGDPGNAAVMRYNSTTGAFIDSFVPGGSGGLAGPKGLAFAPNGNLLVSSATSNQVLRYDGTTGAFVDAFVSSVASPNGLAFGPDLNLYVGSATANTIDRYNGTTGALMSSFIPSGAGGLGSPRSILFLPPRSISPGPTTAMMRPPSPSGAIRRRLDPRRVGAAE
jgi:DNA-binding beta-propeller fold protein YncE